MKIYMIGLGKMGLNLAMNMKRNHYQITGFDISSKALSNANNKGINTISDLKLIATDKKAKVIWVMLPPGEITNDTLKKLESILFKDDIVIDGGNSDYHDSIKRADEFKQKGIAFLDIGTSGGTYGALHGANFMVGGSESAYKKIAPLLKSISATNGLLYCGKSGSGHYLKIIHNAILHSELEVLGEGFSLLHASPFNYNLEEVASAWNKSAVIRGWLMKLMSEIFKNDAKLSDVNTTIHSSSAAIEAMKSAFDLNVPVPMFGVTLTMRQRTQTTDTYSARVINSLRKEIGGYNEKK